MGNILASTIINSIVIITFLMTGIFKLLFGPSFAWFGLGGIIPRTAFFVIFAVLLMVSTVLIQIN